MRLLQQVMCQRLALSLRDTLQATHDAPVLVRGPQREKASLAVTPARLPVELRVMAEDALLVERQAALRGEIRGNPWTGRYARVQRHHVPIPSREPRHRVRKRVMQPGHDLEQRQVCVGEPGADKMGGPAWVAREHTFEIADVFR